MFKQLYQALDGIQSNLCETGKHFRLCKELGMIWAINFLPLAADSHNMQVAAPEGPPSPHELPFGGPCVGVCAL